ncbi:hypothetical protein [Streptomyces halobius]|uniref:Small secreted domain DUF320 n=1 Tax=Streptomyces halobius TaxID=2879846 RepID=A0ABY4M878_9ACTN|nr:hypothetical protein [Streptomyces halobius]UQA93979.1 hypothetical protein K9S39_20745 [Streptomyces halobius]
MGKLRKAAVVAAVLGSVGFLGTGPAYAGGGSHCKSHDFNLDILGEVGILNGLLANLLNGEGSPGAQATHLGSTCGGHGGGGGGHH